MTAEEMTPEGIIIDSDLSLEEALRNSETMPAPQEVLDQQAVLTVIYYSFDGKLHQGQVVVNKKVAKDVEDAFDLVRRIKFPIGRVVLPSTRGIDFNDETLAFSNISSGFNYRFIAKTDRLSNHAFGFAIDINPMQNPYIRDDYRQPRGVDYDPTVPGAITKDGAIVAFFKERGWDWGGDWTDRKDYMHFEKPNA